MIDSVKHASSIEEIGRESWDALAGEEIFANYGWLRTLETAQQHPRPPVYWWIEDEDGLVAAIAGRLRGHEPPAWIIDRNRYGLLAFVIRPLRSLIQRRPTLVCGGQMAPAQPILTRPGLSENEHLALAKKLLDAVESHCREKQWSLVFRGIVAPKPALVSAFQGRPYIIGAESPGTVMDIHWNSWAAYLRDLKKAHGTTEKVIRQQVNRGRRGGVTIEEVTDPAPMEAELHHILAEHHVRKNRTPFYMGPKFMSILKENLDDRAVILVARKDDRIVGVSIHMRNSSAMQLKFVGIDENTVNSKEAVYFNITYHQLIERACRLGYQQLYLGILTYRPKFHRGARLVPTSSWIWEPSRIRAGLLRRLLSFQARRQERMLLPYSEQSLGKQKKRLPCYQWQRHP